MEHPPVPFIDLAPTQAAAKAGFLADLSALIDSGELVAGPAVGQFELEFAARCGRRHCVGVASGTDALLLALIASGVEPGDDVLIPAFAFVATAEAVVHAGAHPLLGDISETDLCLDPAAARAALSDKTRAIVPVHMFGQLADVPALAEVASAS